MTRDQWYNLYHAFRYMRRLVTVEEALAWVEFYSVEDRIAICRVCY